MAKSILCLGIILALIGCTQTSEPVVVKSYQLNVCIVSGNDLGSMGGVVKIVHEGQEVKFCCEPCIEKFNAETEKFLAKLTDVNSAPKQLAKPPPSKANGVRVDGALRAMFHQGQTGPMVTLDKLLPNPNLYAVGALTELSGEVTIVGGKTYLSFPDGDRAHTEMPSKPNHAATLLVSASVPAWRSVTTKQAIDFKDIDAAIGNLAMAAGMNLDLRFPFLLEGEFTDLHWHVIDGRRLPKNAKSHKDHLAAAVQEKLKQATAVLIGFYSKTDQGVFTHMGSHTHIHCVIEKPLSTGHVDHVVVPAGTTIKFPVLNKPAAQ